MKSRSVGIIFGILLLNVILSLLPLAGQNRRVNIGIVVDGPWERNQEVRQLFENEILELLSGEFDVRFPEDKFLVANWEKEDIQAALDRLLADPSVDVILAMGVIASHNISHRGPLPKPVIAPFVIDVTAQDLPSSRGGSGVKNLNYIAMPSTLERDAKAFLEIVSFSSMAFLMNKDVYEAVPEIRERTPAGAKSLFGIELTMIPVGQNANDALNALTPDIEAVYIAPLTRLNPGEFDRLVAELNERKLPTFSLLGRPEVEMGVLAGLNPDIFPRLSRRVALNLQRILLGEDPDKIPYAFVPGEELVINMRTARQIEIYPPWGVYTEAVKINEEKKEVARTLTLQSAVLEGIDANLDLRAKNMEVKAGEQTVNEARSPLLPQIDLSLTGVQINRERAGLFQAERNLTGTATLSQVIYADDAQANYSIQKNLQRSLEQERESLRLDIAREVASAYLQVLISKTLERIQAENLKLTHSNLELARVREAVGYSGPADVYRWESQIAANRQQLINANARRNLAEIQLNRLLNRYLEESFETLEVTIEEAGMLSEQGRLFKYMANRLVFRTLRNFFVQEGIAASPEIQQLEAAIAAQERFLKNTTRNFFIPNLVAQAEYSYIFKEGGEGAEVTENIDPNDPSGGFISSIRNKDNWSVALNLSYPLFSGGAKFARRNNALETLSQLRTERQSLVQKIEQRVRSSAHTAGASYAFIKQSHDAAEASLKNLKLVVDSYSQGVLDITQLLDAQNAALVTSEAEANSIYQFLIDLMELERAIGTSYLLRNEEKRETFFDRLDDYFERADVRVR
jgi:outer membrane protein TolC/ABC-type uncharacterized transport system substrate-binding protein